MSGHSKWAQIKRQKGAADAKRGSLFTKLGNAITIAAREGGGNPDANFKLRLTIDRARGANMPKDNIERAIKRGTGELAGGIIEEVVYEAFGPGGSALMIESLTDNKNRSLGEVKAILKQFGGTLAGINSVAWMFDKKGVITLALPEKGGLEKTEETVIESGAEDLEESGDQLLVYTAPDKLHLVMENLQQAGLDITDSGLSLIAKNPVSLNNQEENQKLTDLLSALDDSEEVNNVYLNVG